MLESRQEEEEISEPRWGKRGICVGWWSSTGCCSQGRSVTFGSHVLPCDLLCPVPCETRAMCHFQEEASAQVTPLSSPSPAEIGHAPDGASPGSLGPRVTLHRAEPPANQ